MRCEQKQGQVRVTGLELWPRKISEHFLSWLSLRLLFSPSPRLPFWPSSAAFLSLSSASFFAFSSANCFARSSDSFFFFSSSSLFIRSNTACFNLAPASEEDSVVAVAAAAAACKDEVGFGLVVAPVRSIGFPSLSYKQKRNKNIVSFEV